MKNKVFRTFRSQDVVFILDEVADFFEYLNKYTSFDQILQLVDIDKLIKLQPTTLF